MLSTGAVTVLGYLYAVGNGYLDAPDLPFVGAYVTFVLVFLYVGVKEFKRIKSGHKRTDDEELRALTVIMSLLVLLIGGIAFFAAVGYLNFD
jgi:hypothetical protein